MSKCIYCGKELSKAKYTRCRSCARKLQVGERAPGYIHGKCLQKGKKCVDCGASINYRSTRCYTCNNKQFSNSPKELTRRSIAGFGISNPMFGKPHSDTTKSRMSISHGGTGIPNERRYTSKFNNILKTMIRERDNNCCQECGFTNDENRVLSGVALHVHHIDYDRKNCELNNLISLCNSCHIKTNKDRAQWKEYYQIRMRSYVC